MARFCTNCGNELGEYDRNCGNCGAPVGGQSNTSDFEKQVRDTLNDVKDDTFQFTQDEINKGKGISLLCYLGILVFIPFLTEKENRYVLYHSYEGLNLLVWEILSAVLASACSFVPFCGGLLAGAVGILQLGLLVIGIINASSGKAKELPLINKLPSIVHRPL